MVRWSKSKVKNKRKRSVDRYWLHLRNEITPSLSSLFGLFVKFLMIFTNYLSLLYISGFTLLYLFTVLHSFENLRDKHIFEDFFCVCDTVSTLIAYKKHCSSNECDVRFDSHKRLKSKEFLCVSKQSIPIHSFQGIYTTRIRQCF